MRTKYKNTKKVYKSNHTQKIYPHSQMNSEDIQIEEDPDFQNDQVRKDEEKIKNYNQPIINDQKERMEYYNEENLNEQSLNKNNRYQKNIGKGAVYYKASDNKLSKHADSKNEYYFNNFNNIQNNEENDNEKLGFNVNNPENKKSNEKYYYTEKVNNNYKKSDSYQGRKNTNPNTRGLKMTENSLKNNQNSENNINNNEEEQKDIFTPKYYRNNPLVRKGNIQMKKILMGNREENPLKSVAQKICNINIKGDNNTHKYKKSYENIKKLKNNISDDIHFDNTNDNEFEIEED